MIFQKIIMIPRLRCVSYLQMTTKMLLVLALLLLLPIATHSQLQEILPSSTLSPSEIIEMKFRVAVLHAPPFATVVEKTIPNQHQHHQRLNEDEDNNNDKKIIEYGGIQIDLLERMKVFAANDGILLNIELNVAPTQYGPAFDLVANDCNTTVNPNLLEDCLQYDVMIANFYSTPTRSLRATLSPGWLRSTISTIKYIEEKKSKSSKSKEGGKDDDDDVVDFTTMTQASKAGATVCLKGGTFYSGVVVTKFPGANYYYCNSQDDCLNALKDRTCVLYASDELQLRHRAANDNTLQVTPESFNTQYISWAIKDGTSNTRYFNKWIYDAITNSTMDELYFQYFQKELCPVGTAGEKCEKPCDPNFGKSDDRGICVCISTKYTGDDCSIEIQEELNLIPQSLKILAWVLVGINFTIIVAFAIWLFWKRDAIQVRMSQPFFLCLILLGCLISSSTIIAMMQEDYDVDEESGEITSASDSDVDGDDGAAGPACMAIPWLYSVGFSITFGTLFAKIRRVYKIFLSAADMRRHMVTFRETLSVTAAVLAMDIAILTVWTVTDPLRWERTVINTDKFGDPLESEGHCTCDGWQWWTGTIAIYHLGLLGFACYLCYESRDIPTKFSEGKYVSIAMFSNLQIFIVGVPILIILGSEPDASFFVRTVIIWMNDFMVVTLIFGNLIYHVHFTVVEDQRTVSAAIASAISTFSNARKERSLRVQRSLRMSSSNFDKNLELEEGNDIGTMRRASNETPPSNTDPQSREFSLNGGGSGRSDRSCGALAAAAAAPPPPAAAASTDVLSSPTMRRPSSVRFDLSSFAATSENNSSQSLHPCSQLGVEEEEEGQQKQDEGRLRIPTRSEDTVNSLPKFNESTENTTKTKTEPTANIGAAVRYSTDETVGTDGTTS